MFGKKANDYRLDASLINPISLPSLEPGYIKMLEKQLVASDTKPENEEWIWVEGYKGTDKDLRCRGYQYELGKQFDMPEDVEIVECRSGFHLCKELKDVLGYYSVGDDNRFFKVSALVRARDYNHESDIYSLSFLRNYDGKLAAKSIIFLHEVDMGEVFKAAHETFGLDFTDWTDEDKKEAMHTSISAVIKRHERIEEEKKIDELVTLGYSRPFAVYLVEAGRYDAAQAIGSQSDLSMDMKCLIIFRKNHL